VFYKAFDTAIKAVSFHIFRPLDHMGYCVPIAQDAPEIGYLITGSFNLLTGMVGHKKPQVNGASVSEMCD
jgi:hypothetical protein